MTTADPEILRLTEELRETRENWFASNREIARLDRELVAARETCLELRALVASKSAALAVADRALDELERVLGGGGKP